MYAKSSQLNAHYVPTFLILENQNYNILWKIQLFDDDQTSLTEIRFQIRNFTSFDELNDFLFAELQNEFGK